VERKQNKMKLHKDCKIELAASKEDSRYVLTEPYLDMSKDPVLVATSGAAIAVIPVEVCAEDIPGHVGVDALKLMRKSKRDQAVLTKDWIDVEGVGRVLRSDLGKFPNWRAVVPDKDREVTFAVGLNIKMLWELCQAIGCETARLEFKDNLEGVLVKPTSVHSPHYASKPCANENAYGVIMPTRLS